VVLRIGIRVEARRGDSGGEVGAGKRWDEDSAYIQLRDWVRTEAVLDSTLQSKGL
jgi:hypothetical protein